MSQENIELVRRGIASADTFWALLDEDVYVVLATPSTRQMSPKYVLSERPFPGAIHASQACKGNSTGPQDATANATGSDWSTKGSPCAGVSGSTPALRAVSGHRGQGRPRAGVF